MNRRVETQVLRWQNRISLSLHFMGQDGANNSSHDLLFLVGGQGQYILEFIK